MSGEKISVFILDDHQVVREGLKVMLEASGQIVVLGESACRTIRSIDPTLQALMLTSYDDDEALFAAVIAGAAGYVLKDVRGNDILDAIKRVAAGQSLIDPALMARVLDRVRNGPQVAPELQNLTEQELRLLGHIAEGLTNRQISERMFLAEKTVKNYVSALLHTMGLERRTQAAVVATKLLRPSAEGPQKAVGERYVQRARRETRRPPARERPTS